MIREPHDPVIPNSRREWYKFLARAVEAIGDPVIEVHPVSNGEFSIRVGQNSGLPRYFLVKVSEQR